jgi:hypothetical protein
MLLWDERYIEKVKRDNIEPFFKVVNSDLTLAFKRTLKIVKKNEYIYL